MALTAENRGTLKWIRVVIVSVLIGVLLGGVFASDFLMTVFMGMPRTHDEERWAIIINYSTYHFLIKWMFALIVVAIGINIQKRYESLLDLRLKHRVIFHEVRAFVMAPNADEPKRDYLWAFVSTVAQMTLPYLGGCLGLFLFPGLTSAFNLPVDSSSLVAGGLFVWLFFESGLMTLIPGVPLFFYGVILGPLILILLFAALRGTGDFGVVAIGFLIVVFLAGSMFTEALVSMVFFSFRLADEIRNAPWIVPMLLRLQEEQGKIRRR
ncbi:hypothetical protein [Leptolyngbya sp. GGD]|uniref:hypothetical protein n=1 Tax=Leptolyngbya sp. GGD TaxID=2997907 RepID=UPI00227A6628|nr:hypothetical protein [Leptolyngbya sp. GGD]MCY6494543.1 hypothetical protein [Leptolyngbya sp. GGD]